MARPVTSNIPRTPKPFEAPQVPQSDKLRTTVKWSLPDIPKRDDAAFLARYAAWRAAGHPSGSLPEYVVWEYLVTRKHWVPGEEFVYQLALHGGRTLFGGFVADFYIRPGEMIWNVHGLHFHLLKTQDRAKVALQKADLTSRGYRVISLWEDDLFERPEYTIEAALRGQETNRHADDVGLYV